MQPPASTNRSVESASSAAPLRRRGEEGVGLISTLAGFLVFAALLLLAVQVVLDLFTRSFVASAAFDAARVVAGSDASPTQTALSQAEQQARAQLGEAGREARFSWDVNADEVRVVITVHNHNLLPAAIDRPLGLDAVTAGAQVRRERVR
jgi:hypothetical protein